MAAVNASWQGAGAYSKPIGLAQASWWAAQPATILPLSLPPGGTAGTARLRFTLFAQPSGIFSQSFGAQWALSGPANYRPPQYRINASWQGAVPYQAPQRTLIVSWDTSITTIAPGGIAAPPSGFPLLYGTQFLAPQGWASLGMGEKSYALHWWQYAPPQWRIDASWVGKDAYPGLIGRIDAAWALPQEAKQVSLTGWQSGELGTPVLDNRLTIVAPTGYVATAMPAPNVRNGAAALVASGFSALTVGTAVIFNWRQFLQVPGFPANLHGVAYVQGGVKTLIPTGLHSLQMGGPTVINTRAEQRATPQGIAAPGVSGPAVSPRMLAPTGIFGTGAGFPFVQFPPRPVGWLSSAMGYPVVDFKTKLLQPTGVEALAMGFPTTRDRAQRVLHEAQSITSIFGDVRVQLRNFVVRPSGWDALVVSEWSEILSTRRWVYALGGDFTGFGGAAIRNKTPSLEPGSIDTLLWGVPDVGARVRMVAPSGITLPFGQLPGGVVTQTPSIAPAGIAAPAVLGPTVWPGVREVLGLGWDAQRLGTAGVDFSWRRLALEGWGIAGAAYGDARVELAVRFLRPLGREYLAFGDAWVSRGQRAVEPVGIAEPDMHRHQIGGTRYLGPEGFEATRWLSRIVPELQEVFPKTFGASYGWPTIENRTRPLEPLGITTYPEPFMHWGVARVWNLRQIVAQLEGEGSDLWPPAWSRWTEIENRNKLLGAQGYVAVRFGGSQIDNRARLVAPTGIAFPVLPEYEKTGSVTHRVRPLPLEGIESPLMSQWAVVYNKAFPLRPPGAVASEFGRAEVVNLRRSFQMVGFEAHVFGYPFIAYAIRELTFESRYGIAQPPMPLPVVDLYTRYLEPAGIGESRFESKMGSPALGIFWRRIEPRWAHRDLFGDPVVRNRTPELRAFGRVTEEFGDAFARLQWRPVQPEGTSMELFGPTRIADRRQVVTVPGNNYMAVGDKVTVRRIGAEPVATQYIDLRLFTINQENVQVEAPEGYGIRPPLLQVGVPDLLKGYIFHGKPISDPEMLAMGTPYVTANTIRVEPGYFDFFIGEPTVTLRVRTLDVPTIGQLVLDATDGAHLGSWGKPAVSPHTIYAVLEATDQALRNHNRRRETLHVVDSEVRFGRPALTMWSNIVQPFGFSIASTGTSGFGAIQLVNKRQYVLAAGTAMGRMGWPTIPGPQTITIEESISRETFGQASVGPPPYVGPSLARPDGVAAPAVERPVVDFYHRQIRATGFFAQAMGASGSGSTVNMPQNLHVGPRRPNIAGDLVASAYGEPWVSLRVRGVAVEGFESFLSEYDEEHFALRMRVRRIEAAPAWQVLQPAGIDSVDAGAPDARPMRHYIRPDGNSEQYRKGAF